MKMDTGFAQALKMPDSGHDKGRGEWVEHVEAVARLASVVAIGARPRWLYQMRPDPGRRDAIAEILQAGSFLALAGMLGIAVRAVVH